MAPSGLVEKTFFCLPQRLLQSLLLLTELQSLPYEPRCCSPCSYPWSLSFEPHCHSLGCLPFKPNMFKVPSGTSDPATSGVRSIIPDGMECPRFSVPWLPTHPPVAGWQPAFSSPSLDCLSPASPSLQCKEEGLWLFFFSQKVSMTTGAVAELWLLVKLAVSSLVSLASLRSLI